MTLVDFEWNDPIVIFDNDFAVWIKPLAEVIHGTSQQILAVGGGGLAK